MPTDKVEGPAISYKQGKKHPRKEEFNPPPSLQTERKPSDSGSDTNSATTTDTSDEFNWSEEDSTDAVNQERVRAKRGRRVWLAFMKLARPVRVFLVCLLGVAISITPLVVVNVRFNDSFAKMQVHVWSFWVALIWSTACATYILVDFIPHLVILITTLFGGTTERLKIQVDVTWAVKAWLKLLLDVTWTWIALSVLRTVYNPPGTYWTVVNRVMQALFSASVVLFIEKLFLQFIAINFHEKALADRLAENRLGLKALDRLSNAHSPVTTKRVPYTKRGHKPANSSVGFFDLPAESFPNSSTPETTPETQPAHMTQGISPQSNRLPKRKKKAMTSVIVDQVGGAIGQITLKNSKFHKEGDFGGLHSARRLARKLFSALGGINPPRSHLVVEDFYPYFRSTVDAHDAFNLFDKDGNGDISKSEMRDAVQRIYLERKALAAGLKDVGSIVAKLDGVLLVIALIVIIFLVLLIFNRSNTLASLVPLASIVLGFSFIFGNSAATLFESLIFIFSTHVFDVGDLVMIDDQVLFVKEFGLFSTTFRRVDGQEVIAPNSLLSSSKLVHNLRRSKSMWETTALNVSYETPMEAIEQLRTKITTYVASNNREWSDCALNIDKMEFQNAIYLNVSMEHRPNWQDWGGRWTRRTAFMRYLKTVLEELEIRYTMPIQPIILPQSNSLCPPQTTHLKSPPHGPRTTDPSLPNVGNAGLFRGGEYGRPAGPVFRDGVPSF